MRWKYAIVQVTEYAEPSALDFRRPAHDFSSQWGVRHMRLSRGLSVVIGALLATGALAAAGPPASTGDSRFLSAGQPSAPGDGDPGTRATSTSASESLSVSTGFQGHFSCRTFSGQNRELAAAVSDLQVARVAELLRAGADINARSEGSHTRGMTLLQTAVWHRWGDDCVRLLIDAGASLEACDGIGNTALVYACQSGPESQLEVVASLVSGGAQVNCPRSKGDDSFDACCHAGPFAAGGARPCYVPPPM